jgi:hypothetical protein
VRLLLSIDAANVPVIGEEKRCAKKLSGETHLEINDVINRDVPRSGGKHFFGVLCDFVTEEPRGCLEHSKTSNLHAEDVFFSDKMVWESLATYTRADRGFKVFTRALPNELCLMYSNFPLCPRYPSMQDVNSQGDKYEYTYVTKRRLWDCESRRDHAPCKK